MPCMQGQAAEECDFLRALTFVKHLIVAACLSACLPAGDAQADKYLGQLEKKAAELQALQERQRLELEQQWEEYKSVYVKASSMYQVGDLVSGVVDALAAARMALCWMVQFSSSCS